MPGVLVVPAVPAVRIVARMRVVTCMRGVPGRLPAGRVMRLIAMAAVLMMSGMMVVRAWRGGTLMPVVLRVRVPRAGKMAGRMRSLGMLGIARLDRRLRVRMRLVPVMRVIHGDHLIVAGINPHTPCGYFNACPI